jgi:hypothetical protein
MVLQGAEPFEIRGGLFGFVGALTGLLADASPSFLDADVGQLDVKGGKLDGAVVAFGAGRDCVKDVEVNDLSYQELTEEFTGLEGVRLETVRYKGATENVN